MANRRGRGKGRPQQRRTHLHLAPAAEQLAGAAEQDLIRSFRRALRSREPIDLLMTTSAVMSVLDPRQADPFESSPDRPSLAELVDSLIAFDVAETTAALTVIGALTDDRRLAHRIADELATRRQPLPAWLAALDAARAGEYAWLLDDILGDGESHAFEVELTPDTRLTAVVYVDHTLDGVVKDAFVAPESIASMADRMRATLPQEHRLATADLAETRARVTQAVDDGLHTYPPLETDTWPACRPLVEWMLRLLPEGGTAPERHEWTEAELTEITDAFLDSRFAVADPYARDLLGTILWFAGSYTGGDPWRWSEARVVFLLMDWLPRKVIADVDYLAALPEVLRAFIGFCHDERAVPPERTAEVIATVDELEPEYLAAISSPHREGPAALLASMFPDLVDDLDLDDLDLDELLDLDLSTYDFVRRDMARRVGGTDALEALDDAPLPDEEFDASGIAGDVVPVVTTMLVECDRVADELLDVEQRTAMRRLLRRIALADPDLLRRKASPIRGAAAVAWIVNRANPEANTVLVQDLVAAFGVHGSVSQRAQPMLRAIGAPHSYGTLALGTPDLLTAATRAAIIGRRVTVDALEAAEDRP